MKTKPTKEQLFDLYITHKMSRNKIAKQLSLHSTTILNYLKEYDIPRRSISESLSGLQKSESHKLKLSESKKGPKHPNYGKKCKSGKRSWYKCPDGKTVSMRSSWEVSFAKYLDMQSVNWQYEPKTFVLSDGSAYTPDFYLPNTNEWVEVKGWFREEHKKKIESWKKDYPKELHTIADKKYLISKGIDIKQIWITSKPKFRCIQCNNEFYRNYPDQKLCSVTCRNKFIANNDSLPKDNKPKRKYSGIQSGENNSGSKLTLQDVRDIKTMRASGIPVIDIAKQKNSSASNIYNICRGDSWKEKL